MDLLDILRQILNKLNDLEQGQTKLVERFAGLEQGQNKLEERFAGLEQGQNKLEERLNNLECDVSVIKLQQAKDTEMIEIILSQTANLLPNRKNIEKK